MENALDKFNNDLKILRKALKELDGERVNKKTIREQAEQLGTDWLRVISPKLRELLPEKTEELDKYGQAAERLIKLSAPSNRKSSYLEAVETISRRIRDNLILPLKTRNVALPQLSAFDQFVADLQNPEEEEYFNEAIQCAKNKFLRAATVLAWCAAIDRIHRKIEAVGFAQFNVTSAQLASEQKGRYKRFNKSQNVISMSDLRQVFDTDVLWIIEGMNLIDSNQHTRLRSCFDMRNHSAHPGEAPITEFNVMSLFSDIQQIVLTNAKFDLRSPV